MGFSWFLDLYDLIACSLRSGHNSWLRWCLSFLSLFCLWCCFSLGLVVLLLLSDILFLRLSLLSFFALLAILSLLLLISMLRVLLWSSLLEIFLVEIVLVASVLISMLSILRLVWIKLLTLHLRSLSNEHLRLLTIEIEILQLSLHGNRSWGQIFIWIESSKGSHFSKACYLNERWWLWVQWAKLEWTNWWTRLIGISRVIVVLFVWISTVIVVSSFVSTFNIFWNRWKSYTLRQVRKRIN